MQQMSALDNLMFEGDLPNIPLHMSAITIYDSGGKRGRERLRSLFEQRFADNVATLFPILRCKAERVALHLDRGYWVEDPAFDLANHISHVALPKREDWAALYQLFGEFHARPLDPGRPLWEVMFVEGLDHLEGVPRGACALFFKIHHAVFDGKGALRLVHSFHNLSAEPDAPTLAENMNGAEQSDYSAPSLLTKYTRAWWHGIERPVDLAATVSKMLPALWQKSPASESTASHETPPSLFNHAFGADRVIGHVRMEMAKLRRLEKKHGCTINDIALGVIGGALRDFLGERGALPDTGMMTLMPMDIRRPGEDGKLGNHVNMARICLHTDIDNCAERLQAIHGETKQGKRQHGRGGSHTLIDLIDEIHPALMISLGNWLVESGHLEDLPPLVNTVVTNVPGMRKTAYIGDARLIDYLGFGPLAPNVGLFHTVSSTDDHVNISFLSNSAFLGDGGDYLASLQRSWSELSPTRRSARPTQ